MNVQPTFEENQKFLEHDEDGEETFVAPLPVRSAKKDIHFTKGDVVMVMEGELKTMRGVVESVKGTCVEVRPTFDGYDDTVCDSFFALFQKIITLSFLSFIIITKMIIIVIIL